MSRTPKRSALSLFTLIVLASSAGCDSALTDGPLQSFSCDIPGEGTGGAGEGAIAVRDGEVQSVSVHTWFPGLPGNLGYSCYFDAKRGDNESSWTVGGAETTVDLGWPDGNRGRIVPLPGGYKIDLRNAHTGLCGAGAQLPEEITILETGGQCRVVWDDE